MILNIRPLKFMSPADDAGAAVAEPPPVHAEPPTTSIGDVYKAALVKEQGEPGAVQDEPTEKPPTEPKAPAKAKEEKKPAEAPARPASALDAALETKPEGETTEEPVAEALKDLPETLPREGRGDHWKQARGVIATQSTKISELTKQITTLSKQAESSKTVPPEILAENAALKAKLDSYKDAIVELNIESDPEYRAKYVQGREAAVNKAASKLSAFGGNGDALKEALTLPEGRARNQAIKEAMGELEDVERSRVMQFIGEVERLDDEKAEMKKDPQQAYERLERKQADARQKANEAAEAYKLEVFDKVSKTMPSKLFLLRPVDASTDGADEWNNAAKEIREGAFKLLGNDATPEQLAEAALWATAGPKLQTILIDTRSELTKARAALKEYEQSEPGFRGGKPPKKTPQEEAIEKTPGQIFSETMAKLSNPDD